MAITYEQAGVDIDAADRLVTRIKSIARGVQTDLVVDGIGGFAGLLRMPEGMVDPVLVSGTDGVGTKLELAMALNEHDTVGIDLVAMCVNDILTVGARPLFFLDYLAVGKLDVQVAEQLVRGVAEGCRQASCALLGGETAEMPGMYGPGKYDLAGFVVGVVERDRILDGKSTQPGDVILAVASSGPHSNGYSLIRRIVADSGLPWDHTPEGFSASLGKTLLTPTRIYASSVQKLLESLPSGAVRGMSHITGGGIVGNLPRVLPESLGAVIDLDSYQRPHVFQWLAAQGPVEEQQMRRVFNLGVGLCVIVRPDEAQHALNVLEQAGETAWKIGSVVEASSLAPREHRVRFLGGQG